MAAAPPWHALDRGTVEAELRTNAHGLSEPEARARLERYGANELAEALPPSVFATLLHQFRSPLIYILLLATVVTVLLGDYLDAGVIAIVLVLNAVIGFTQERRAEASVRALTRLLAPHARVIRGGREWDIASRDLVPGDLILLESGTRVPADLRLVTTTALAIDESLLTGESLPAAKQPHPLDVPVPLADRINIAYAGTVVTSGRGRGYVVGTGAATALGAIAAQIRAEEQATTPLERRMGRFARTIGVVVAVAAATAFGIGVARGERPTEMFKAAVALAVSAVPEGLPVACTITLALGVRRMARRNAIIRRLPAVETLGSTTVIGTDKTGTLTENRMTVQMVWAGGRTFRIVADGQGDGRDHAEPAEGATLAEHRPLYLTLLAGVMANEAELDRTADAITGHGDPTEIALLVAAARLGIEPDQVRADYPAYADIPFESERRYAASFRTHDGRSFIFVKGAPERVLAMCESLLTDDGPVPLEAETVHQAARALASHGLRVLGMAYGTLPRQPAPMGIPDPRGLAFLGLTGMMDPPRAGVREAITGCREAGIRVIMITGDHALTARAIGLDVGIAGDSAPVLTGADLERMDDAVLDRRLREVSIYARMAPEHKLRVVQTLRRQGEVVAVTGDGANDAPALKAADIGIAMGKGGTDVAREAADMVLADDNFVSIYAAIEEGRNTFDNIRKVTFFLISTGAAEIVTILTALTLGWPLPFLAAQLLWLNLVTNGLQDVALAFEPGDPGVLRRRPRQPGEGILSTLLWERTVLTGLVMAAGTLAIFRWELDRTGSLAVAQTAALTTMVLFQMIHVGNARSEFLSAFAKSPLSNPFLLLATLVALGVHTAALYLPPTQYVLRVAPIEPDGWVRSAAVALTIVVAIEVHKLIRRPRLRRATGRRPARYRA